MNQMERQTIKRMQKKGKMRLSFFKIGIFKQKTISASQPTQECQRPAFKPRHTRRQHVFSIELHQIPLFLMVLTTH